MRNVTLRDKVISFLHHTCHVLVVDYGFSGDGDPYAFIIDSLCTTSVFISSWLTVFTWLRQWFLFTLSFPLDFSSELLMLLSFSMDPITFLLSVLHSLTCPFHWILLWIFRSKSHMKIDA